MGDIKPPFHSYHTLGNGPIIVAKLDFTTSTQQSSGTQYSLIPANGDHSTVKLEFLQLLLKDIEYKLVICYHYQVMTLLKYLCLQ